ncbi:hypothetical protein PENTCL1PPCAC_30623, partial [Pristionchus entomophagus]
RLLLCLEIIHFGEKSDIITSILWTTTSQKRWSTIRYSITRPWNKEPKFEHLRVNRSGQIRDRGNVPIVSDGLCQHWRTLRIASQHLLRCVQDIRRERTRNTSTI